MCVAPAPTWAIPTASCRFVPHVGNPLLSSLIRGSWSSAAARRPNVRRETVSTPGLRWRTRAGAHSCTAGLHHSEKKECATHSSPLLLLAHRYITVSETSINSFSVYGAVADWCEELAQQISDHSSTGTGNPLAKANDESESGRAHGCVNPDKITFDQCANSRRVGAAT